MTPCMTLVAIVSAVLSAASYTVEWQYELEAPGVAITPFPDANKPLGVVAAAGSRVIRLGGNGSLVWQKDLAAGIATPATVADLDGDGRPEICAALSDGTVVCLAAQNGDLRWSTALHASPGGFKMIAAADLGPGPGLELVVGFDDGWLTCLNADGAVRWRFHGDRFRVGPPAVGDADGDGAGEVVYGTDNGHVYCLEGGGQVRWRYGEEAPYGRSGPVIARLDRTGSAEILITRSNVGLARGLMALDGATGAFHWRTDEAMQSYVSIALADLDGDGACEMLHGDKGNWLYCTNADGHERWRIELGGRGLFWAPAVADVDGDGALEILAGVRGNSADTGACAFVIGPSTAGYASATIEAALELGGGANASPAAGDFDGDNEIEAIFLTQAPERITAITWHAAGAVAWASGRGDSAMSGAGGCTAARTASDTQAPPPTPAALSIDAPPAMWGENAWPVAWSASAPEGAFIELSARSGDAGDTWIVDVPSGATEARVAWRLHQAGRTDVTVRLMVAATTTPLAEAVRTITPPAPDTCQLEQAQEACDRAMATGQALRQDTQGLATRLLALRAEREDLAQEAIAIANGDTIADGATRLRAHTEQVIAFAESMGQRWANGQGGTFVWWRDDNPWDAFDPRQAPPAETPTGPLRLACFGNEFEDMALTLLNTSSEAIDVRCMFVAPQLSQASPQDEPALARHVTLRRCVAVPSALHDQMFDALPELDLSRTITLPPGQARQLWIVVNTNGLPAGRHELTLYLGSLTTPPTFRAVPIAIEVWPFALPTNVFAKMNWCSMNADSVPDQAVQDMIDHGISCVYGPPLPSIGVDVAGAPAGEVDWQAFDATLRRIPRHFFLLWSGPPAIQWPASQAPAEESMEATRAFEAALNALAQHLESLGVSYDRWAFYPMDEPWNTGFGEIPRLRAFCERVKRANPRVQNYADPCGYVRVEHLEPFKELIDVWQPEMNLLKRDPALVEWFTRNAKHFWAYEAPSPAKDLPPLAHYRAFAWLAWKFGCEGAGYWIYRANDIWWPVEGGDWAAVYSTNENVVPSRRWEADRDGVEDFRALTLLRRRAQGIAQANRAATASAEALIAEAVDKLVGWQAAHIDEITRMTRDYDFDLALVNAYRARIAAELECLEKEASPVASAAP